MTSGNPDIPNDHPRAQSLHYRHKLVDGMYQKIVTPSGLTAHGRGEAFDYLLGETTIPSAKEAMTAAVAALFTAEHPVISVNGNIAGLIPEEIVQLSKSTGALLEINIFYRAEGRIEAIKEVLEKAGADQILGCGDIEPETISELSSNRRIVDPRGIYKADVVLVPLEDGDRTEALVREGKFVITIDLNPLSRTAQQAQITIVDNVVRCVKEMVNIANNITKSMETQNITKENLLAIVKNYDQKKTLKASLTHIVSYLSKKIEDLDNTQE